MTVRRSSKDLGRGVKLLHDPVLNKGTAFDAMERETLGLRGLLPPRIHTQDEQVERVLENVRSKPSDLERYIYLVGLQDRNEALFYRVVTDYIEEMMPLIYTPTVGKACQHFGHIFRRSRGLYISLEDRGHVEEILHNWPHPEVRVIVVTDGERILGLGDLGADGMGIPIGKLALYTACAGIPPTWCLPVMLDVGTDNQKLLDDPLYLGLGRRRERGGGYLELVDEFLGAARRVFPKLLIQLEDFGNANAFHLLEHYRDHVCTFDDDIQGTGSVVLAGILSALRISGQQLTDQRLLFLGAGEAGLGIGQMVTAAMREAGLDQASALETCWFFDSRGLVVSGRDDLAVHKRSFAHDHTAIGEFEAAVEALRPTCIVGACGQPGRFSRPVLERMARHNRRPIVFALSNPTSKAECTAAQAYEWSEGRAIFASGSPFDPVVYGGERFAPGQANNAYVFPGVGLGVVASEARHVNDEMFFAAARAIVAEVGDVDLAQGRVYPALSRIREVSLRIAVSVAEIAYDRGLTDRPRPESVVDDIRAIMYDPAYPTYV